MSGPVSSFCSRCHALQAILPFSVPARNPSPRFLLSFGLCLESSQKAAFADIHATGHQVTVAHPENSLWHTRCQEISLETRAPPLGDRGPQQPLEPARSLTTHTHTHNTHTHTHTHTHT